jgi:hypothetical protein
MMRRTSASRPRSQGEHWPVALPFFRPEAPTCQLDAVGIVRADEREHLRGRHVVAVVARLLAVELGAEVLLDGALVYGERVAAAHMQL